MNTQTSFRMLLNDPKTPYVLMADLGRALSSPARLRLLHLLCQCDRTVEELAEAMNEPLANVSHHLQLMKKVRLVTSQRIGRQIAYGLGDDSVRDFWHGFKAFSHGRIGDLQLLSGALAAQRSKRGGMLDGNALAALLKDDAFVIIDVRPKREYDAGHIPGAVSFPLNELMKRINELPKDKTIVLYCRGPYCLLGDKAQEQLAERAIKVYRLEEGIADWIRSRRAVRKSPGYKPLIKRNEP